MNRSALKNFLIPIVVVAVVWMIWNETFSLRELVRGLVLALITVITTSNYLLREPYGQRFNISPFQLLRFVFVLIIEIFRSGFHAIHVTLTNRINIGVIDVPVGIHDPLRGVLVSSAITLTPGTVTIDYDRNRYKIIWIDCPTTDPEEAGELIKGTFERILTGGSPA